MAQSFPREEALRDLLRRHEIGPALWEIPGPRRTGIRRITAFSWGPAKAVVIVQEYGTPFPKKGPWTDIDGWEIYVPVNRTNAIADVESDLTLYRSFAPASETDRLKANAPEAAGG